MSPSGSRVARGALSTALLSTVLALGVSGAPSVSLPAPDGPVADGRGTAGDLLPRTVAGREALRVVGEDLAAVAALNGRTESELRSLLLEDASLVLTPTGRLAYRDDLTARSEPGSAPARATYPTSQTFTLHSRPGSKRTIFLDFDGATSYGSQWSTDTGTVDGFSLDGDPAFNAEEHATIQEVWQRVAEDYAPFDVDVTTEDPGQAAITRSGSNDQVYGTRAQITGDAEAHADLCGNQYCTGIAYIGVFDEPNQHASLQPAWAFTRYFDDVSSIAETVSHEVGHNLGLDHHGKGGDAYYAGHANWAPIMGSGLKPVIQWSNGDYSNATSPDQDDLALITDTNPSTFAGGLSLVADEAGSTVATAAGSLPSSGAIITSRTDKDVFALGTCTGPVAVTASPAPVSPNLDISLDLLDAGGNVLDTDDPTSDFGDGSTAGGMGATVSITDGAGRSLFVRVDGVGTGSVDTGYDDYGSIGHYTLDVTCEGGGSTAEAPGAVTGLSASSSAPTSATATWSAPADDGGSSITGYRVSLAGGGTTLVSAGTTSHTFTGLSPDTTYTVQVAAVNAEGDGPTSSTQVTTQADEVVEPTDPLAGPKITKGSYNRRGTKLTLKWAPVDDAAGYVVVFTNRRGKVMDFFDQGQRTRGRVAMRKVSKKARFVQMVAYDLDGNIGDYGKRWRL
ncbi:MAG: fibronectin type III domain-containing protein [Actinobacteria bacterium]|nr:fibronectin type III domain-containing protein [Actinomycetota bacterium]